MHKKNKKKPGPIKVHPFSSFSNPVYNKSNNNEYLDVYPTLS